MQYLLESESPPSTTRRLAIAEGVALKCRKEAVLIQEEIVQNAGSGSTSEKVAQNTGSGSESGSGSKCRKRLQNVGSGSQEMDDEKGQHEHSRCNI
jgi:hypothetical protein